MLLVFLVFGQCRRQMFSVRNKGSDISVGVNGDSLVIGDGEQPAVNPNYNGTFNLRETLTVEQRIYTVTHINTNAFENCSFTAIFLPKTIIFIGDSAFANCNNLVTIDLSKCAITTIPSCFATGCRSLARVNLPDTCTRVEKDAFSYSGLVEFDTKNVRYIDGSAFKCCFKMKAIRTFPKYFVMQGPVMLEAGQKKIVYALPSVVEYKIPKSVSIIGPYSFYSGIITHIHIPSTVKTIGFSAFEDCIELYNITFNDGCEIDKIYDRAFFNTAISDFDFSHTLRHIGSYSFSCTNMVIANLTTTKVRKILTGAFSDSTYLRQVHLPSCCEIIESRSFSNTCLEKINFPQGLKDIGDFAFYNTSLVNVNLLKCSITELHDMSFAQIHTLKTIILPLTISEMEDSVFFNSTSVQSVYHCGPEPLKTMQTWGIPKIFVSKQYRSLELSGRHVLVVSTCPGNYQPNQFKPLKVAEDINAKKRMTLIDLEPPKIDAELNRVSDEDSLTLSEIGGAIIAFIVFVYAMKRFN